MLEKQKNGKIKNGKIKNILKNEKQNRAKNRKEKIDFIIFIK